MQEKIEERHKKIAHIQNTIWEIYKTFLNNHDITEYEHKWAELLKTYQNINDEEFFSFCKCLYVSWEQQARNFARIFRKLERKEEDGKKPSEVIKEFLNFLETAKNEYESAYSDVGVEDRKEQTFLHDLEFAPNKNERNKVATRFQQSRKTRRKAKDRAQLYECVSNFYTDKQNQNLIKALRRIQNEQITREKYLFGNREFKNRVE